MTVFCKKKFNVSPFNCNITYVHIHLQENLLRNVLRSPEVNHGRKSLSCHQAFFYSRDLGLEKRINKVEQNSLLNIAPRLHGKKTSLNTTRTVTWFEKSVLEERAVTNSCSRLEEINTKQLKEEYKFWQPEDETRDDDHKHGSGLPWNLASNKNGASLGDAVMYDEIKSLFAHVTQAF